MTGFMMITLCWTKSRKQSKQLEQMDDYGIFIKKKNKSQQENKNKQTTTEIVIVTLDVLQTNKFDQPVG
ncbi:hypothetical protein T12_14699 [Trichinella patagoniensis]|uniref:Uncharacterized protein n=1 Tax=Trichinella patagoniensis TaxID=990121 RepID=A0A0V1AF93_9BILA|nr:hypothetical protein T12_14699 [Trichinella patagoniensis]